MPSTKPIEPDLFEAPAEAPSRLQITGVLIRDAEVRMKAIGTDDRPMPVLCLEVITPGKHTVHAEQTFPHQQQFAADAVALRLKKGTPVTLVSPIQAMRLVLPHIEQVCIDAPTH